MTAEPDILATGDAGRRVIRGSVWRILANVAGIALGLLTAALLLHHLGVAESGRYVTVLSLVNIPVAIADTGLNVTASRTLALRESGERPALIANVVGLKLIVMPVAVALVVAFALAAAYPARMVVGTLLAGFGALLAAIANALLLKLTVELRNVGLSVVDFMRQAVTLAGVAVLVAAGAKLTPFFAVLILTGLVMILVVPLVAGAGALSWPRFDRSEVRELFHSALPMAIALGVGQVYFRLVIVLMSLISSARQTGYFGGSLRAMESLTLLPSLTVSVALPLLAAAARDDRARLRYAVEGLGRAAVIVGVLIVIVTVRAAEPVMVIIGGHAFRPAGAVLRIQVGAMLFIMLYSIWSGALLALGRQRELILTNALALAAVAVFAAVLVPEFGGQGGATASVLGDAVLSVLIYWRLARAIGGVMVSAGFLARLAVAAAAGVACLFIPGLPNLVAAALSGIVFIGVGQLVGMVPTEVLSAFGLDRLRLR